MSAPTPRQTVWRRILCAVHDGMTPDVMGKAVSVAKALDAEIELFDAVFEPSLVRSARSGGEDFERGIRVLLDLRRTQLETMAASLRARHPAIRVTVLWDGPSHEAIVRQVLRREPDLLIAATRGKSRLGRLLMTWTDYKLIEDCPCPLLLMKGSQGYRSPRIVAALDPDRTHDKPATLDTEIVGAAEVLTRALRGELHLYHAREPWPKVMRATPELRTVIAAVREEVHEAHCAQGESLVMQLASSFRVPATRVHVEEGVAARCLPRFANGLPADVVAMGAVSLRPGSRPFLGRTAERVLDALHGDVLIVKPAGFRTNVGARAAGAAQ